MPDELIGEVTDFFARPVVAAVLLSAPLKIGDTIRIKGHSTDLQLQVTSMQVHNQHVAEGKTGDNVGIKAPGRVRHGDKVYRVA